MRRLTLTLCFLLSTMLVFAEGWPMFGLPSIAQPFMNVKHYTLQPGDTVSSVALQYGLAVETLLSYNAIKSPRLLRSGQTLRVPDRDGVMLNLTEPTPVVSLAETYKVYPSLILLVNQLPENTAKVEGSIFVPGAHLDSVELRKLLGEYFLWPTKGGRISSYFGARVDPFTGEKSRHSGVDIANYYGAPVLAAGSGVVVATGFDSVLGNYIRVDQGQGFAAVYGHLSAILTSAGRRVVGGQLIGKVGSTGYSTGPHLHFSAYRWGQLLNPMMLFG